MNILFFLILISLVTPNKSFINAGPMVGYSSKMEVALWIQTTNESDVKFLYWDKKNPSLILETENFKQVILQL